MVAYRPGRRHATCLESASGTEQPLRLSNVSLQNRAQECCSGCAVQCSRVTWPLITRCYSGYCAEGEGNNGREQPAVARAPLMRTRAPNRAAVASVVTAEAAHAVSEDQHEGGDAGGGVESTSDGDERGFADPG